MPANLSSSQESRLQALKHKHAVLSEKVDEAQQHPSSAEYYLKQLKKQKLVIKEEIQGLIENKIKSRVA